MRKNPSRNTVMKLMYFPANSAWAFVYGKDLNTGRPISMGSSGQVFFPTRAQAVNEARIVGLRVTRNGSVYADNARIPQRRLIAGTRRPWTPAQKPPIAGAKRRTKDTHKQKARPVSFARNNPGSRRIGTQVIKFKTTKGTFPVRGNAPIYGLKDGSVFIKGFFTNPPGGFLKEVWYMDDAKAGREGFKEKGIPWKHDYREKLKLEKTQGGLIIRRKDKPLWGMR